MPVGRSVLLLTPPLPRQRRAASRVAEESCPPLGLLYLGGSLLEAGVTCQIRDFYARSDDPIISELPESAVVGISFTTPLAAQAYALARSVKEKQPDCLLVAGGHHATAVPEDCLSRAPFDVVLSGEAEESLCLVISALDKGARGHDLLAVPGAVVKADNAIRRARSAPRAVDVKRAARPARQLVKIREYSQGGAIVASRGCPGRCIFCSAAMSADCRRRDPIDVVDEVAEVVDEYAIRDIFFLDDAFTVNQLWVMNMCETLISLGTPIRWGCSSRTSDVDPQILSHMAAAGCRAIHFGAESGDADVLRGLHKGGTPDQTESAVTAARAAGISNVSCSFVVGAPDDTEETVAKSIDFAAKLRKLGATHTPFSIMTPYPGSALFREPERFGVHIHSFDWDRYVPTVSNISTRHLSQRRIEELYFDAVSSLVG